MDVDLPSDLIESAKMAADVVRLRAEVAENDALLKRIHREGVIEGLAQAQGIAIARVILKQPERIEDDIKLLIERLRAEQKGTVPLCRVCQQPQDYIHGDTCSRCAPSGPPQTVQKEG